MLSTKQDFKQTIEKLKIIGKLVLWNQTSSLNQFLITQWQRQRVGVSH